MPNTKTDEKTLSTDHYTLEHVAQECIGFQTEDEALKEKKGTISDHFMDAAKVYIQEAPTGEEMPKDHPFLLACNKQELASKSEQAGIHQWDKVPASWSQMKSNIKASYNMGIDINTYESESSLRKDLNEKRKEKKEDKSEVGLVDSALSDAIQTVSPELALRLFAIIKQCKDLTDVQNDDVLRILDESLLNITTMKELVGLAELDKVG